MNKLKWLKLFWCSILHKLSSPPGFGGLKGGTSAGGASFGGGGTLEPPLRYWCVPHAEPMLDVGLIKLDGLVGDGDNAGMHSTNTKTCRHTEHKY